MNLSIFVFSVYRSPMRSVLNNTHIHIRPIVDYYGLLCGNSVAVDYCPEWIIINSTELVASFFTTFIRIFIVKI